MEHLSLRQQLWIAIRKRKIVLRATDKVATSTRPNEHPYDVGIVSEGKLLEHMDERVRRLESELAPDESPPD